MGTLIWEAHIDWLTATYPRDSSLSTQVAIARAITEELRFRGEKIERKGWAWQGYTGETFNGMARGERYDGIIVKCSGERSHGILKRLPAEGMKATRLDLALTVWLTGDDSTRALREHMKAEEYRRENTKGRPWQIRLVNGTGDGDTLYLGSRSSDAYGRLYDKGRETGNEEYQNAWRWEVEYKGDAATKVADALRGYGYSSKNIAATVQRYFDRRGVSTPLDLGGSEAVETPKEAHRSDENKKLLWLKNFVAPSVKFLLDRGLRDEVLSALGLSE